MELNPWNKILMENIRKVTLQFMYVNNVILLMSIFKWITIKQSNKLCIFVMSVNKLFLLSLHLEHMQKKSTVKLDILKITVELN